MARILTWFSLFGLLIGALGQIGIVSEIIYQIAISDQSWTELEIQSCLHPTTGLITSFVTTPGDKIIGAYIPQGDPMPLLTDPFAYMGQEIIVDCTSEDPFRYLYHDQGTMIYYQDGISLSIDDTVVFTSLKKVTAGSTIFGVAYGTLTLNNVPLTKYINTATSALQTSSINGNTSSWYPIQSTISGQISLASVTEISGMNVEFLYSTENLVNPWVAQTLIQIFSILESIITNFFQEYEDKLYWNYLSVSNKLAIRVFMPNIIEAEFPNIEVSKFSMIALGPENDLALIAAILTNSTVMTIVWDINNPIDGVYYQRITDLDASAGLPITQAIDLMRIDDVTGHLAYTHGGILFTYRIAIDGNITTMPPTASPIIDTPIGAPPPINITINGSETVTINEPITLDNLIMDPDATLIVLEGAVINVTGCATLSGTLQVILRNGTIVNALTDDVDVLILTASCRNGEFDSIELTSEYDLDECERLEASPNYSPSQLSILVSVDQSQCPSDIDYTALIIGVVIGGAVFIVGVLLLAFYCSPIRNKVFPYAKNNN